MSTKADSKIHPLAAKAPTINVIGDGALLSEEAALDKFELLDRVGPIFDIIRHPKTRPPMAIAIYGDWGTGKTSAMRWLDGLLRQWNEHPESDKSKGQYRVRPVWFYPWKYQTKEDVWRGLIAEVILASINVGDATPETVKRAVKQFGSFLGRSFIKAVSAVKLSAGHKVKTLVSETDVRAEFNLAAAGEIVEEFNRINKPHKAFLNHFEESLRDWVEDTISENERLCIFIDDLDRCMPEVGLQVLEALKLYLNIDRIIFVVGVDREVVQQLVEKHYESHGLTREKSRHYLAKMFQVEVQLGPSESQMRGYLKDRLDELSYWKDELDEDERAIVSHVMFNLAEQNPREVKRTINSALIASCSAVIRQEIKSVPDDAFTFRQRLQIHLVDAVLVARHRQLTRYRRMNIGDEFFRAWSAAVREIVEKAPGELVDPEALVVRDIAAIARQLEGDLSDKAALGLTSKSEMAERQSRALQSVPEAFREMVGARKFATLLPLLADLDLAWLMRLDYPVEASKVAPAPAIKAEAGDDQRAIVERAVRASLNIGESAPVTSEDIVRTKQIVLPPNTTDHALRYVAVMARLRMLTLRHTAITDIGLGYLTSHTRLTYLDLFNTSITHAGIASLTHLTALTALDIGQTQVTDEVATVLRSFPNLRTLFLNNTRVTDTCLENLRGLPLTKLNLRGTQITDGGMVHLKTLAKLDAVNLLETRVTKAGRDELRRALPNVDFF